jgi:hypothetical protein
MIRLGIEINGSCGPLVRNDGAGAAPHKAVMPRACGASSTLRPFDSITDASEYWIARRSLSSGGASRRPRWRATTAESVARSSPVMASEAKQSIAQQKERWIASLRSQ